jgi:hypothetical protein
LGKLLSFSFPICESEVDATYPECPVHIKGDWYIIPLAQTLVPKKCYTKTETCNTPFLWPHFIPLQNQVGMLLLTPASSVQRLDQNSKDFQSSMCQVNRLLFLNYRDLEPDPREIGLAKHTKNQQNF